MTDTLQLSDVRRAVSDRPQSKPCRNNSFHYCLWRTWLNRGERLPVAVDISARTLFDPNFATTTPRAFLTVSLASPARSKTAAPVRENHWGPGGLGGSGGQAGTASRHPPSRIRLCLAGPIPR
jgi:hypothetical protein